MLLPDVSWAGRVWALFLAALAPSERYAAERHKRHKTLTGWGRQVLPQALRWLPGRQIIGVADSSDAAMDLLNAVRGRIRMITRLRLDARLFDDTPALSGGRGRSASGKRQAASGKRQANSAERPVNAKTRRRRL